MNLIHYFAVNLRRYRKERGYSQEYLAELAGLHRTYISAVEREKRNISIDNIGRIAEALDINAYELLMPELNNESAMEVPAGSDPALPKRSEAGVVNG